MGRNFKHGENPSSFLRAQPIYTKEGHFWLVQHWKCSSIHKVTITITCKAMNCFHPTLQHQLFFPDLLYNLLEDCERSEEFTIISWSPQGRSFKVHDKEVFTHSILPRYFRQSKYKSFARQCKYSVDSECRFVLVV